tara:strand:+ start:1795 stop:2259 length:465 start_codon:yes stop_codon:yes gene_type:complete
MRTELKYIKRDKCFVSKPLEGGHECCGGPLSVNITLLTEYIESNLSLFKIIDVDIKDFYRSIKDIDVNTFTPNPNPCIYAEISPTNYSLIDGSHRSSYAELKGKKSIKCYKVPMEIIIMFFISDEVYSRFVQYWNSKVDEHFEDEEIRKKILEL